MNKRERLKYENLLGGKKVYEMTSEELQEPITKEMGELCRHRLEKRWYRRLVELNFLIIIVTLALFAANFADNWKAMKQAGHEIWTEWQKDSDDTEDTGEEPEDEATFQCKCEKSNRYDALMPEEMQTVAYGILLLAAGYIALYAMNAKYRATSLRITERNFPEVYKTVEEYAERLGITVPKVYVVQQSGVLNAFSTFLFRRQWILIHAELFEVAYREHHDMEALNFVIAHEMAHIYYGHATLHYNLLIWFANQVPVLSAIASRAREYSCDRLAQRLTGNSGIDAMLMTMVDRHLYKMVDREDYLHEAKETRGFFIWAYNMIKDHPIMTKRIIALEEGRGSGAIY